MPSETPLLPSNLYKHMRIILLCGLIALSFTVLQAQTRRSWEDYLAETAMAEELDEEAWANLLEELTEAEQHPIALHTATREQLEQLPFLSARQVEDICAYLYRYGTIRSWGELAMIESLDRPTIGLLSSFVTLDTPPRRQFPSWQNILKYGRHELLFTAATPFYKRQGDRSGYLGYPYKHSMRYAFNCGNAVKAGLIGAQDAGEPFFDRRNRWGYDHYAGYLMVRNLGRLKTLVVGNYRLNMALGLVINNDYGMGKNIMLSSIGRQQTTIKGHASRLSANYLQGAAATWQLTEGLDVTLFASYRSIDATLSKDGGSIVTLPQSGYHRTKSEWQRKNSASEWLAGGRMTYRKGGFRVGLTAVYNGFDRPLRPDTKQTYRRIMPSGDRFFNLSADYGYISHRLELYGETAIDRQGAVATAHRLTYQPSDTWQFVAFQRFYAYRYDAIHAQSVSEGGKVKNENGLYAGVQWRPTKALQLFAYSDFARFAWPRYRVMAPSSTWDYLVQAVFSVGNMSFSARYRLKMAERNNSKKTALTDYSIHRARLAASYKANQWQLKTQAEATICDYLKRSWGCLLSQDATFTPSDKWFLQAQAAYFNTEDYNSRIYLYERGVRYSFSFPAYFGHGIHSSMLFGCHISSQWSFMAHLSATRYFDRNHISSGLQRINSSSKVDAEVQLRWRIWP